MNRPRPSILIVEDEAIVAMDLQQTLAEFGYDAYAVASSAAQAIEKATSRCPDLVLMDIRIKGTLDGIETALILKSRFSVPIIFLTAHADDETLARAKQAEPHGYLVKPVKPAELRSGVEVALYKFESEKRLREREQWFSTTLSSIADAVVAVDLAGRVTYMNRVAEAMTGIDAANAVGRPMAEVVRLEDRGVGLESSVLTALRERRAVELEEAQLRDAASGTLRIINESAAPLLDHEQPFGAVTVFRDVTDQRSLQAQLELSERVTALGAMAAKVAHEVNNPLAVIMASTEFVTDELRGLAASSAVEVPQFDAMTAALADLGAAARAIGRTVANLRSYTGQPTEMHEGADVARCVDWALQTTAHEFRDRATVSTNIADVPLAHVDEMRLGQVLTNLLTNAAHAIAPGDPARNEVVVSALLGRDGRVAIEVRDTGAGIPTDSLPRVCDPFFTTKQASGGTGLGLSICHGIVQARGGELEIKSEVGQGTVVRVLLQPVQSQDPAAVHTEPGPRGRARILVIDDEDTMVRAISRMLSGHDLQCVMSAQGALSLIEGDEAFDVILCDLMMHTMTGKTFYERLLALRPALARRVAFITGGATTRQIDEFLRSVSNRFLEKPFSAARLQTLVRELLEEHGTIDAPTTRA